MLDLARLLESLEAKVFRSANDRAQRGGNAMSLGRRHPFMSKRPEHLGNIQLTGRVMATSARPGASVPSSGFNTPASVQVWICRTGTPLSRARTFVGTVRGIDVP